MSAIVLGLSLSTVLASAGLAVDAGLWYNDKRTIQGVADLAAWTAGQTYYFETNMGTSTTAAAADGENAAQAVVEANGYTVGSSGVTVTVNNPPLGGANKGVPTAFEVILSKPESVFFSSAFLNSVTVTGRAVAGVKTVTTGSGAPACIFSKTSITMSNGVSVSAPNCAVDANGTGSGALTVIGGASLTSDGISVVGGITQNNGGSITDTGGKATGAAPVSDPYAGYTVASAESAASTQATAVPPPNVTPTGSSNTSCSSNNTPANFTTWSAKPITLTPGIYCGGLSVGNGVSVNFSPGIYVINGGTFSLQSGANTATGVTIVLTGNASFAVGNGATFAISAPSSGPTAGLAFFGDPNNTGSVSFNGGTALTINGAIYFPNQTVNFSNGSSNTATCTELDAYSVVFTGGTNFGANCTGFGTKPIGGTQTTSTLAMLE